MTNSKSTKRALFSSALAVFLCVAMLIGTTFAWFTDTASTSVNKIQAGKLDVALEMYENGEWVSAEGKTLDFVKAEGHENEAILWEPGCTYSLPELRIKNNGNLALKYKVAITGIKGDAKLNEVIDWTISGVVMEHEYTLNAGATQDFTISGHMQETAGNTYQNLTIESIAITVNATQATVEYDSNSNQYDKDASLFDVWDGTIVDSDGLNKNTDAQSKTVKIENAAQLAAFADAVKSNNTYSGYTVTLESDIDLGGQAWSGIGANSYSDFPSYCFNGTFDGQGHTIYNMTISNLVGNTSIAGFFNGLGNNAIVKNLNFENANVTSNHQAGVVAGYCNTAAGNGVNQEPKAYIENCHVNNSTVVSKAHKTVNGYDDGDKAGGIIGYTFFDVKNCSVKNTTITGYRDLGGIVGYANANQYSNANVTGNTVENVTIYVDKTHDYKSYTDLLQYDANAIVGETASSATVSNNDGTANVYTTVNATTNNAEEVATALKSTANTISVTLSDDVTMDISSLDGYTGGSGQYKLGGTDTTAINIDLNGHKLALNTTYWSALGAKNPGAVITVKNGSMNSVGNCANTWNAYDLTFYDCKWNFEDVTFDKAVAIATGTTAAMKNVTINESHDYYALWITLEGQTVSLDNVTINCPGGRGIAINNQYVKNPQQVTLNINGGKVISAKKAAVIVKNVESEAGKGVTYTDAQKKMGADVTVSGAFDISGVDADTANAIWKDSDNTTVIVNVTGATVVNEQ